MKINADLRLPAAVDSQRLDWTPSPLAGVHRRMLERDGGEVARATSIVRYAPDSVFSRHTHAKGEEFLVLDGTFTDESGDFRQGMYVRNPPGSGHTPSSAEGCRIFVKLRQMHEDDAAYVRIDTRDESLRRNGRPGERRLRLYDGFGEAVSMLSWTKGAEYENQHFESGAEYFVIDGCFADESGVHKTGAWLRLPRRSRQSIRVLENTIVYRKTGHLGGL